MRVSYTTNIIKRGQYKMAKDPASSWRRNLDIPKLAPLLATAAIQLQIEGISDETDFHDPKSTKLRQARANLAMQIIESCLSLVGEGTEAQSNSTPAPRVTSTDQGSSPRRTRVSVTARHWANTWGAHPASRS